MTLSSDQLLIIPGLNGARVQYLRRLDRVESSLEKEDLYAVSVDTYIQSSRTDREDIITVTHQVDREIDRQIERQIDRRIDRFDLLIIDDRLIDLQIFDITIDLILDREKNCFIRFERQFSACMLGSNCKIEESPMFFSSLTCI